MNEQLDLFGFAPSQYIIKKPIRLIELFAGIGAQSKALEVLKANFESYKIAEWSKESIKAYTYIHHYEEIKNCNDKEITSLNGISRNYSEPMTKEQINNLKEDEKILLTNCKKITHNLIDISKVKGEDLNIVDTDKYEYIMTFSFPCVTKDSLILTEKGYIPFEDVKIGMKVLTKGNTWEKVVKKFDNGKYQTYKLNAMGFENIIVTENHKFYVREKYRKGYKSIRCFKEPVFKEVKDITKNDYFGIPVINEEQEFYTNDIDFWFMIGMYVGDGWLSKSGNDIIISCNEKKLELLKQKLDIKKYNYTINKGKTCYRFRFANKEIYNFIRDNIGTGCLNKHIPLEIIKLRKEQLQQFYNGYLNSDGCVIKNIHQFSSTNKNLIYSISLIINKLYKRPTRIYKVNVEKTKIIEGRIVNQKDWYQLRFKLTTNKQDKAFYENGYIWYPFKSLEKYNVGNVYNMEVENDHSYIVQGCISKNCQDLSLSGKLGGMEEGSGTRSSLLWEVERLLKECKEKGNLPNTLLMENVPQVIGTKNKSSFHKFMKRLEDLGYKNFVKVLNSKDFYIPQNRQRCFMVSILTKEDVFSFPNKMKLDYYLLDFLDKEVDEKYYLSDDKIIQIQNWKGFENPLEDIDPNRVCSTLTTHCGKDSNGMQLVLVPENTKKGYAEAKVGDGVYINRPHQKRGVVQKGMIQTIKTSCNDIGVVVDDNSMKKILCNKLIESGKVREGDVIRHSYTSSRLNRENKNIKENNISPTLDTRCDCLGVVVNDEPKIIGGIGEKKSNNGTQWFLQDRVYDNKISPTICASVNPYFLTKNLRIRKLTPCECYKLMGFTPVDYEKCAEIQSNATIYHQAGDSIVVTVLIAIFGKLLGIDYEKIIKEYVKGEILNENL